MQPQETATSSDTWSPQRGPDGRWLPGQGGRPRGIPNKFASETMKAVRDLTPQALEALRSNLDAGNLDAAKFVLERVIGRQRAITLQGDKPSDVSDALINGEISTDEARAIATVLEKLRRIEDLDAVVERLAALERLLQG